ncbi:hypothetical protein [Thermococcus sp. Bubb.Bath]|uniref:hypothetical protein n=1 Tax=Thermococcus sp. Bubb.Bath TaxID=1638242 RepID=UPI001438BC39|nr:hypothetical protein [Thermococcus sp. Bubb.Bath]NJF25063.1 hypothetical protein [Thermococcus sp. Bubb.Bath]
MKKRLFMFVTSDGLTYSSADEIGPDTDNFQVLGFGDGIDEGGAFRDFIKNNKRVLDTHFREVTSVEVKHRIYEGKLFYIKSIKS